MATAGPNGPSTGTSDASVGVVAWVNPGNITADDTNFTTNATTFGGGQSANWANVRLVIAGTISGNTNSNATAIGSTQSFIGAGSSSDLWGLTLAPSDINNANFGVVFSYTTTVLTISQYIKAVGFGFSIPAGSTINGVLAEIESKSVVCFPKGTLIRTFRGLVPIEKIRKGTTVLAFDKNGQCAKKKVLSLSGGYAETFIKITAGNQEVMCTPQHRFFTGKRFKQAQGFKKGDCVMWRGTKITVSKVERIHTTKTRVYNFEVEDLKTYIANGFYVHNTKITDSISANYIRITVTYTPPATGANGNFLSLMRP